ncbi:MAG: right-handed parallel beta-helix repeat-containing protein [Gemmatimonadota bacterium]
MTTYFVSPTGNDGNTGLGPADADAWLTIAYAITQMVGGGASFDSGDLLYLLDGTYSEVGLATGAKQGLTFEAVTAGEAIISAGAGAGLSVYNYTTVRGLVVTGAVTHGIEGAATNRVMRVEDCVCHSNGGDGIYEPGTGSEIRRVVTRDNAGYGINCTTANGGVTVEAVETYDNGSPGIQATVGVHTIRHVTAARNAGAWAGLFATATPLVDCVAFDNLNPYGMRGASYTACCSFSSNPAIYHASGNFYGAAGAGCIETDPAFADAPGDDFTLTTGSPCVRAGAYTGVALDIAGRAFTTPPSMGARELPALFAAVVRASNQIWIAATDAWPTPDALDPDAWQLTSSADTCPLVAAVEMVGTMDELIITTDRRLVEGVTYTLTPTLELGGIVPASVSVVGRRVSLPPALEPGPESMLLDFDAPLTRPDRPGGQYTIRNHDYVLTGGAATVIKMVWARLLTVQGELYWDRALGANLGHKRLRPVDLRSEQVRLGALLAGVPHVLSAHVHLSWDGSHMVVGVQVETDLGSMRDSRMVGVV